MELVSTVAAGGNGSGDFVVGLLVGCCIGFLVGPAFRAWQAYREWSWASREALLADRLLERMEIDADLDGQTAPANGHDEVPRPAWQTLR
ncbi:MAG: hypothetical protein M3M93_00355 [Actinomycetota bacterium]|nr:hypothetical protein [Actinomycetota bacterium]